MDISIDQVNEAAAIVGVASPFVTALIKKARQPEWFSGLVSITLAAIGGVVLSAVDGGVTLDAAVSNGVAVWLAGLASWLGISSDAVAALNAKTARFGISLPAPKAVPVIGDPTALTLPAPDPLPDDDPEVQEALLLAAQQNTDLKLAAEADASGRTVEAVAAEEHRDAFEDLL